MLLAFGLGLARGTDSSRVFKVEILDYEINVTLVWLRLPPIWCPGNDTIEFGPGQRTARLLIPLVRDVAFEDNEAFKVELMRVNDEGFAEVYAETAIIIRDDDS